MIKANMNQLTSQILHIVHILESEYSQEIESGFYKTLYTKYKKALYILESNGDIKGIKIKGGVRAYLDCHSDYMHPFVIELGKAESLVRIAFYWKKVYDEFSNRDVFVVP